MSRIGKQPVAIPGGVKVQIADGTIRVEGPKGKLELRPHPHVQIASDGKVRVEGPKGKLELAPHPKMQVAYDEQKKVLQVTRPDDDRQNRSLHGLTRSLIANMVTGVTTGYQKRLKIEGIGYQARMEKTTLVLAVGYANAVELTPPPGVTVELTDPTTIIVKGADRQKVGQFAANVRGARPPEPYKGKGVRYETEQVRHKEGKSFTSGG